LVVLLEIEATIPDVPEAIVVVVATVVVVAVVVVVAEAGAVWHRFDGIVMFPVYVHVGFSSIAEKLDAVIPSTQVITNRTLRTSPPLHTSPLV